MRRARWCTGRPFARPGRRPAAARVRAVGDATQRADEEDDVVAQLVRARRVLDPAGPAALRHRPAVGVEQALEQGEAHVGGVEQVLVRDELGRRPGARQPELAQRHGDRVRDDARPRARRRVAEDVVVAGLVLQLDVRQRGLQRRGELRVGRREAGRGRAGDAAVAEQQAERVRIQRTSCGSSSTGAHDGSSKRR